MKLIAVENKGESTMYRDKVLDVVLPAIDSPHRKSKTIIKKYLVY